jgi:hypothetical protein
MLLLKILGLDMACHRTEDERDTRMEKDLGYDKLI